MHFDCIVLGLGGFGSAALDHLARRGARVLGIEQFGPAHDRGSSHGETRAIRRAYYEHPDYVPLVDRAFALWRELEQATGRRLFSETGLVLAGRPECEAVAGTLHAAALHRLNIHPVPLDEARRRFPTFHFRDDEAVVYEREAGYLHVEECVRAHLDRAQAAAAAARFHEPVRRIELERGPIRVRTDQAEYQAGTLIVAGGAWSGQLLSELDLPLTVLRKLLFWHPLAPGSQSQHAGAPVFLFQEPEGVFYGFPCLDGRTLKVAEHSGGLPINDPDQLERCAAPREAAPVEAFVRRRLRDVECPAAKSAACMYTMTPDGHFIVDRHPLWPNVLMAAGFSGHGFKFTPAIGQALADLALDGRTTLPIDFLSARRPALAGSRSVGTG